MELERNRGMYVGFPTVFDTLSHFMEAGLTSTEAYRHSYGSHTHFHGSHKSLSWKCMDPIQVVTSTSLIDDSHGSDLTSTKEM